VSFRARPGQERFTVGRAIEQTLAQNPRLDAAARAVEAAKGSRVTAGLRINPSFTVVGFNLNDNRQNQVYQWVQTFRTGGKRGKQKQVAGFAVYRSVLGLVDERRLVVNETRHAFIAVLQALSDAELRVVLSVLSSRARLETGENCKGRTEHSGRPGSRAAGKAIDRA